MEEKQEPLRQYLFENHSYDGSVEEFLEETAPLIGYIIHSFNGVDSLLNSYICEMINDRADESGANVIYGMSFTSKIDLFYRLCKSMEKAFEMTMPSFEKFIEDLRKCARLRNAVVHAEWGNMTQEGYTYVKLKFNKEGIHQLYIQYTPESLVEIHEFIENTAEQFDIFDDEKSELFNSK